MFEMQIKSIEISKMIFCAILILCLGFRGAEEVNITTLIIIGLTVLQLGLQHFKLNIRYAKKYLVWYTCVAIVCTSSLIWANIKTVGYVYSLLKDVYIPLVCVIIVSDIYIRKNSNFVSAFDCLIAAELFVILRAIINTPWRNMITTFDSRLFGSGLGRNYNDFTTQMALVAIIAAYLSFYVHKKYKKIFALFIVLIMISASRKAIVVALAGYIIVYLISAGKNIQKIIMHCLVLMLILGTMLFAIFNNPILYDLIGAKFMSMIQSLGLRSSEIVSTISAADIDHSMHGRAVLREEAMKQFLLHPLLGIGYYNFQYMNVYGLYAHNNYLELLANLGIVGFITYYSIYIRNFIYSYGAIRRNKDKDDFHKFVIVYLMLMVVMEYAQITFFRLFALIPLVLVFMCLDHKEIVEREKEHVFGCRW